MKLSRILALVLTFVMLFSLLPAGALAEEFIPEEVFSDLPEEAVFEEAPPEAYEPEPAAAEEPAYEAKPAFIPEEPLPLFTVTFDLRGLGEWIAPVIVPCGSTVEKPEDPRAEGYAFLGWYYDEACTWPWNFDADTVWADLTLYACWEEAFVFEALPEEELVLVPEEEPEDLAPLLLEEFDPEHELVEQSALLAAGDTFAVNGVNYKITSEPGGLFFNGTVTVSGYESGLSGDISIPESVENGGVLYIVNAIGDRAFLNCTGLTGVTIPDVVRSIGESAFENCSGLTGVTIPSSVTAIGDYTFSGCTGLTKITIPDSVRTIGVYAFYKCTGLTEITIPNSVTSIGASAFLSCSGLTEVTIPGSVTVIGEHVFRYCTGLTEVTIPNSVTTIGIGAFFGCNGLTNITIPSSVTEIGISAFYECTGLKEMTIPSSVTTIGNRAFYNCTGLTEITIPNSVTAIEHHTFYGCTGLTEVTIPDSVTTIGASAFENCTGLTYVYAPDGLDLSGASIDASAHILRYSISGDEATVTGYEGPGGDVTIPSTLGGKTVTAIGDGVFIGNTDITSVTIPKSVKSIGVQAFERCSNLSTVTFEEKSELTSIGEYAFYKCASLGSITIPTGVKSIGKQAFSGCSNLSTVTFEEKSELSSIGKDAFYNCASLKSITIPSGVTAISETTFKISGLESVTFAEGSKVGTIRDSAFSYCGSLKSITLPATVTSIEYGAFMGCTSLDLYFEGTKTQWDGPVAKDGMWNYDGGPDGQRIHTRCMVTVTVAPAGSGNVTLTPGEGAKSGSGVYYTNEPFTMKAEPASDCSFIEWTWSENGTDKSSAKAEDTITFTGDAVTLTAKFLPLFTFSFANDQATLIAYNGNATEVVIPATATTEEGKTYPVTAIGEKAFEGNTDITSVEIPSGVKSIGDRAFFKCSNLSTVTFEEKSELSSIGEYAFLNCTSLKGITIPTGVTSIGTSAFDSCTSLKDITIPNSVKSIGTSAFERCSNLSTVTFEEKSELTSIGEYAFSTCASLGSITIPTGVKSIGKQAFSGCSNLSTVTFEEKSELSSIGEDAFYNCASLKSITIPSGVTAISETTFKISGLESVTFAEGSKVETIGESAFSYCENLKSITFPATVTSIEYGAFMGCTSLDLYFEGTKTQWDDENQVKKGELWNYDGGPDGQRIHTRCTVTFDANGHGTAPDPVKAWTNALIADPGGLTAGGFGFTGWYQDAACTAEKKWDFTKDLVPEGDTLTLYAGWVAAKELKVVSKNGVWEYDGTARTKHEYTVTFGDESYDVTVAEGAAVGTAVLSTGDTVTITPDQDAAVTKVADSGAANAFSFTVTNSSLYSIQTEEEGTLTITQNQAAIKVAPGSGSKKYDGTPLTKAAQSDFTVTGLPTGFTWTASADGTVTNVTPGAGEKAVNAVKEFKIFKDDEDVTDQFAKIDTSAAGTLTIEKRSVTLTSEGGEKPYDGTPLTKETVTVGGDGFVDNEITEIRAAGSVTTVAEGEVENTITLGEGPAFKVDNYDITSTVGKLKITAKPLTITADSGTKVYDGTALTKNSYSNTDPAAGDSIASVTVTGSQTEAGKSGNEPSAAKIVNGKGDEVTSSYDITYASGELEVTPAAITIKADNKSKTYDNDASTDPELTAAVSGVPEEGDEPVYDLSREEGQDVKEGGYTISVTTGRNPNYSVTAQSGTFTIEPAALTDNDVSIPDLAWTGSALTPQIFWKGATELKTGTDCTVAFDPTAVKMPGSYTAVITGKGNFTGTANASFKVTGGEFTISFVNDDGTVLQSGDWTVGQTPAYTGETPTKAADKEYTYTFKGWEPAITPVTGEATYTAAYNKTVNSYTVTFVNWDGTELQSSDWVYGDTPAYDGETPEKPADEEYTYTFQGWEPGISRVTGEAEYTATFTKTEKTAYTVLWLNGDGTELDSKTYKEGEPEPTTDKIPAKAADQENTYTFDKWDDGTVEENVKTYAPLFTAEPFDDLTRFILRCYLEGLGRSAQEVLDDDADGLTYWYDIMQAGKLTPAQMANYFAISDEAQGKYPDDESYVAMLYRMYMDRHYEQGGFDYWIGLLESETLTREQVNYYFGISPEFQGIAASFGLS